MCQCIGCGISYLSTFLEEKGNTTLTRPGEGGEGVSKLPKWNKKVQSKKSNIAIYIYIYIYICIYIYIYIGCNHKTHVQLDLNWLSTIL